MTRARRSIRPAPDPATWRERRYERAKRRAGAGALPRPARFRTWSWMSTGRTCDGCGDPVGAAEIEHDVEVNGTTVLRLHPECFRAWSEDA